MDSIELFLLPPVDIHIVVQMEIFSLLNGFSDYGQIQTVVIGKTMCLVHSHSKVLMQGLFLDLPVLFVHRFVGDMPYLKRSLLLDISTLPHDYSASCTCCSTFSPGVNTRSTPTPFAIAEWNDDLHSRQHRGPHRSALYRPRSHT